MANSSGNTSLKFKLIYWDDTQTRRGQTLKSGGDIRIFRCNLTSNNYENLHRQLSNYVNNCFDDKLINVNLQQFNLCYVDDENDLVHLGVDDLQQLVETIAKRPSQHKRVIRVYAVLRQKTKQFAINNVGPNGSNALMNGANWDQDEWYLPHAPNASAQGEPMTDAQSGWNIVGSKSGIRTINKIRQIVDRLDMSNLDPNKEFISLSIGDPTKYPNLIPSDKVTQSVQESLLSGKYNGYCASSGSTRAKEALCERYAQAHLANMNESDIFLTSGCSDALNISFCSLLNERDVILLPRPGFALYETICHRYNFDYLYYNLDPNRQWEIDLSHLESIILDSDGKNRNVRIKALLINNPSNPCGSVLSEENLKGVLAICRKYFIPIIADEVYNNMVFHESKFVPIAALSGGDEFKVPVLTVAGLAKTHLVPGWRVGWIVVHDPICAFDKVKVAINNLTSLILGCNTVIQASLWNILFDTEKEYYEEINGKLEKSAMLLFKEFDSIGALNPIEPQGAMYLMTQVKVDELDDGINDDIEFANCLLKEESILVLPGTIFGAKNYFRSVICPPEEVMHEVAKRMKEFCQRHAKRSSAQDVVGNAPGNIMMKSKL